MPLCQAEKMIPLTKDTAAIVAGVGAAAVVGSIATIPEARWYVPLDKPEWKPPDNVFGPAWTALYTVLAVVSARHNGALHNRGCSRGLNPPASRRLRAM
ncbi:hypothetical protein BSZ39_12260 [Bowdeniella nasicola]|uniref:TspO and MBR related proteins n=1 Tax=Bowdeniella nasicola TaxID=208480 RepID=A0A1Q5PZM3_9ACTO|nr:hypothetical protein BSZ39_12260 [Bowdeniella nasicola]